MKVQFILSHVASSIHINSITNIISSSNNNNTVVTNHTNIIVSSKHIINNIISMTSMTKRNDSITIIHNIYIIHIMKMKIILLISLLCI